MVKIHLFTVAATITLACAADPCTLATASTWVSSDIAHACELSVPFNQARSLSIVDSALKSLPYYSLETWFQRSPNPRIPHNVNIRTLLEDIQYNASASGFRTDWDVNIAITDAFNREQDGHTIYVAACTEAFSWNLPFSISTLASTPFSDTAYPIFLVNYDFPNQDRPGLEEHYRGLGLDVRPYNGARVFSIDGVDALKYLTDLANESSVYNGLVGGFEDVNARYMRLMSRYSADSEQGLFTQEVGRFAQRTFYPGRDNITVSLQTDVGTQSLTIPWAATFTGKGNTVKSFITKTCALPTEGTLERRSRGENMLEQRKAVISPDAQPKVRATASAKLQNTPRTNYVQPNRKLFFFWHDASFSLGSTPSSDFLRSFHNTGYLSPQETSQSWCCVFRTVRAFHSVRLSNVFQADVEHLTRGAHVVEEGWSQAHSPRHLGQPGRIYQRRRHHAVVFMA
ncbi:hypothetical protein C8F01DRAFT_746029 [Mycena amicta]|nr:hypothetical protein C8F01DRAFT_746029 [Mycena amicta]